jgi:phosphatidylglycerophosphate synthase
VTEAQARVLVRSLTVSRLLCGTFVLPISAVYEWWAFAATLFIAAAATDLVDGAIARHWGVASKAGARLDTHADIALTFGAMLAVSVGGVWYWWVTWVLVGLALFARWVEPRLRGDTLLLLIFAQPFVNILLISLLAAKLIELARGPSSVVTLTLAVFIWCVIGIMKRERVSAFLKDAFRRTM